MKPTFLVSMLLLCMLGIIVASIRIPANFFWVKCVRFSSCHNWDFRERPSDFQDFWWSLEDFRTMLKMSEDVLVTFEHFCSYFKGNNFSTLCYSTVTAVGHKVNIMCLFEIILGNWIEFSLSIMCWRMLRMDLWVTRDKLSFMCEIDVFGLLFKHFPKPLEIFADPLKALIKPLNDLKSHLSAISFCLFHGNVLMYIFLEKVTFFSKMLGFTVVKSLVTNGSQLVAWCFQYNFYSWLCWFYAFKV